MPVRSAPIQTSSHIIPSVSEVTLSHFFLCVWAFVHKKRLGVTDTSPSWTQSIRTRGSTTSIARINQSQATKQQSIIIMVVTRRSASPSLSSEGSTVSATTTSSPTKKVVFASTVLVAPESSSASSSSSSCRRRRFSTKPPKKMVKGTGHIHFYKNAPTASKKGGAPSAEQEAVQRVKLATGTLFIYKGRKAEFVRTK